jgi:hypothetical protein
MIVSFLSLDEVLKWLVEFSGLGVDGNVCDGIVGEVGEMCGMGC